MKTWRVFAIQVFAASVLAAIGAGLARAAEIDPNLGLAAGVGIGLLASSALLKKRDRTRRDGKIQPPS